MKRPSFASVPSYVSSLMLVATSLSASDVYTWSSQWNDSWSNSYAWSEGSQPYSGKNTQLVFQPWFSMIATQDQSAFELNRLTVEGQDAGAYFEIQGGDLQWSHSDRGALPQMTTQGYGSTRVATVMNYLSNTVISNSGGHRLTLDANQNYSRGTTQTIINQGESTVTLSDGRRYDDIATAQNDSGVVLKLINENRADNSFLVGNFGVLDNAIIYVGGAGKVSFAGNKGGDLFTGSAVLHVMEGGTFQFNGNAESMGAIAGNGTLDLKDAGVSLSMAGHQRFGGRMTGNGTFSVSGANHNLHLHSKNSDYTGVSSVLGGRLFVYESALENQAGALGNSSSEVLLGNTSGSTFAQLLLGAGGIELGRDVRVRSGNSGLITLGSVHEEGVSVISGDIILGTDRAAAKALRITSNRGGDLIISGDIKRATGATGSNDSLTFVGNGKIHLTGNNTYQGATNLTGGTLVLDYRQQTTSKLSETANLVMDGGSLEVMGHATDATVQTVRGLQLGLASNSIGGGGQIKLVSGGADLTLSVGEIKRSKGSTLDVVHDRSLGDSFLVTTSVPSDDGFLGSYATYQSADWAVVNSQGIIEGMAASNYQLDSFGADQHVHLTAATAAGSGAQAKSLKLSGSAGVTFSPANSILEIGSGGILMAPSARATSIGTTASRGRLVSSTGELILHQHSTTGALTIHSLITGNQSLTKTGAGKVILSGTNTYTGNTYINGGVLEVTSASALGAFNSGTTNTVYLNGGTLSVRAGDGLTGGSTEAFRKIHIGEGGGTLEIHSTSNVQTGNLMGSGTLTKTGAASLSFGSRPNTFNGDLIVLNGKIYLNSAQLNTVSNIYVRDTGSYHINDDAVATFSLATGGRFVLNGMGYQNQGAIIVDDQTTASNVADPRITMNREVHLEGTSKITVTKGTAVGSIAQLNLTAAVTGQGGLIKAGNGELVLKSHLNSYEGRTEVQNGVLSIQSGNDRLPTSTEVVLGNGTTSGQLKLNGYTQTIYGLGTAGTGTNNAVVGGSTDRASLLHLNVSSGEQSFSGSLGGVGSDTLVGNYHANNLLDVVKSGKGSLTLSGNNTFSGAMSVEEGVLKLGHERALGGAGASYHQAEGATYINAGATLDLNGQSNIQEIIEIAGNGHEGMGALVNQNTSEKASLGSGIASLSLYDVDPSNWSPDTTVLVQDPSSGATAQVKASFGLTSEMFSVTEGGSGFSVTNGTLSLSDTGGGQGATLNLVFGLTDKSFTVESGTTRYSVAPTVTLRNGATGEAVLNDEGLVVGIRILQAGSNFHTSAPTATFAGGEVLFAGEAPIAKGVNNQYQVVGVKVTDPGQGYTTAPTLTVTNPAGSTLQIQTDPSKMVLNGFVIADAGSGYLYTARGSVDRTDGGVAPYLLANASALRLVERASVGGAGDLDVHSTITGSHGFDKVGAGTTTLTASNQYHGLTSVKEGALMVGNREGSGTGFGSVEVASGATLGGAGSITGSEAQSITLDRGSHLVVGSKHGNVTSAETLVLGQLGVGVEIFLHGNLSFDMIEGSLADSMPNVRLAPSNNDVLVLLSSANVDLSAASIWLAAADTSTWQDGDTWRIIDWSGVDPLALSSEGMALSTQFIGQYELRGYAAADGYYVVANLVPEPRRWMLILLALTALVLRRRRTRQA